MLFAARKEIVLEEMIETKIKNRLTTSLTTTLLNEFGKWNPYERIYCITHTSESKVVNRST